MFCFVLFFLIPLFRYPRLGFNCWRVLTAMLLLPLFLIWLDGRLAGLCSICSKPNPTKFVFQNNRNFVLFQCLLWIVVFRICLLHTGICGWVVCVWVFVGGDYVVCRHWDWVKIGNVVYFFANHSISEESRSWWVLDEVMCGKNAGWNNSNKPKRKCGIICRI